MKPRFFSALLLVVLVASLLASNAVSLADMTRTQVGQRSPSPGISVLFVENVGQFRKEPASRFGVGQGRCGSPKMLCGSQWWNLAPLPLPRPFLLLGEKW